MAALNLWRYQGHEWESAVLVPGVCPLFSGVANISSAVVDTIPVYITSTRYSSGRLCISGTKNRVWGSVYSLDSGFKYQFTPASLLPQVIPCCRFYPLVDLSHP